MAKKKTAPEHGRSKAATTRGRYAITSDSPARVAEPAAAALAPAVHVISATEAARNLSDLINRVAYKGETYVVERGGRPVCQLSPVAAQRCSGADLLSVLSTLAHPAEEFLSTVEAAARGQAPVGPSAWEK